MAAAFAFYTIYLQILLIQLIPKHDDKNEDKRTPDENLRPSRRNI